VPIKKGAGLLHTPHGSPQTTTIYGKTCTCMMQGPNNSCFALFSCGDCEAIEQKVLCPLKNTLQK